MTGRSARPARMIFNLVASNRQDAMDKPSYDLFIFAVMVIPNYSTDDFRL